MLSMYSPLNEMDIFDVAVLRPGTVYKLTGHADEHLILKVEASLNVSDASLKHAKLAMKAVDKKAGNVKALTVAEKQAVRGWVQFMKGITRDFSEDKVHGFSAGPAAQDMAGVLDNPLWYKMPLADLTDADKLLEARLGTQTGTADKSVMRQFADGLNAMGGLEQMGKIVAADMFIGQLDRFNPSQGSTKHYGNKQLNFKVVANIGNIFVIGKNSQQRVAVSGHDFLDPNSGFRHYDSSIKDTEDNYGVTWPGRTLCDKSARRKFAKHIVQDLETILTPNRKSYSLFSKLDGNAEKRLERGMLDGMRDIVGAVDARYGKPGAKPIPAGLKQRRDAFKNTIG